MHHLILKYHQIVRLDFFELRLFLAYLLAQNQDQYHQDNYKVKIHLHSLFCFDFLYLTLEAKAYHNDELALEPDGQQLMESNFVLSTLVSIIK